MPQHLGISSVKSFLSSGEVCVFQDSTPSLLDIVYLAKFLLLKIQHLPDEFKSSRT